jgi:hypothetical protein
MKTKERTTVAPGQKSRRQVRAEKKAVKFFYAELQKEINDVDWANAKLPRCGRWA